MNEIIKGILYAVKYLCDNRIKRFKLSSKNRLHTSVEIIVSKQMASSLLTRGGVDIPVSRLASHSFHVKVTDAARSVLAAEQEYKNQHDCQEEFVPDEHEFYLLRVGKRWSVLLSHCEQLEHALLFMSNYRETPSMIRAGVNRTKHLRFHLEGYIIRTQTLFDLMLHLVDAVFHLTNGAEEVSRRVIENNIRVRRTQIPGKLKPLKKKLDELRNARHEIVHRGGYQDPDLYRLELYSVLEEDVKASGQKLPDHLKHLPESRVDITREAVRNFKAKYSRFNARIFKLVIDFVDVLSEHFDEERLRVQRITR
jgi:hypothetical protein